MSQSKTSLAYQELKQDLLDGVHAPGVKLRIDQLCETYKVSPGAIREALSRLTSDGLVLAADQRGFLSAPISAEDLTDLTAVRISIECRCLQRSIQIGDLNWESNIAAAWHRLSNTAPTTPEDPTVMNAEWAEAHNIFHDSLVAGSDSQWWLRLRDQMYVQAERYRRLLLPHSKVPRAIDEEHKSICEATLARDVDKACDLLEAHLQKTADILLASDAPFADVSSRTKA